jgi:hypothetical protein
MSHDVHIDALWAGFCDTLPPEPLACAQRLTQRLGLAPIPGTPWSDVFKHEVTLAAPALFAPAMPEVGPEAVRRAVLAHLLGIIEAFATDRIEDGQVDDAPEVRRLLELIRLGRDRALEQLTGEFNSEYPEAEARTRAAQGMERTLLEGGAPVSFGDYLRLSVAKQSAAYPASVALARVAQWEDSRVQSVQRVLECVAMGLQLNDDVLDWEDDWQQGRAWAVSLSRGLSGAWDGSSDLRDVRRVVHSSGVQARMLDLAWQKLRQAARLSRSLGAERLAHWAGEQELRIRDLAEQERTNAGYAVRAHQLAPWAAMVLA